MAAARSGRHGVPARGAWWRQCHGLRGDVPVLFLAAGIGSGSTFRMIPIIFRTLRERWVADRNDEAALEQARRDGATEAAAAMGLSAAIAAFGGFFIPMAYGTSIEWTGSPHSALIFFSLFYLSCVLVTGGGIPAGRPKSRAEKRLRRYRMQTPFDR